jgi:N-acetylglucosamine-6-phosphate deacetylase
VAPPLALVGGRLVDAGGEQVDRAVVVIGERISAVVAPEQVPAAANVVDVGGRLVTPGLVDVHVHGALGHAFDDGTDEALDAVTRFHLQHGVTSVLATLVTDSLDGMLDALDALGRRMQRGDEVGGSRIVGAHVEGPYLDHERRGAHNPAHLRRPDDGSVSEFVRRADVIRLMTVAPELPGGPELVRTLVAAGVKVSAGHTAMVADDLAGAVDAGVSHLTHLWQAMTTTARPGPWRVAGLVEAGLCSDTLTVEVIADGHHLPAMLLRLAYRCLRGRLCAVSDASRGTGLPAGSTFVMGGLPFDVVDGVAMAATGTNFGGSVTPLDQMLHLLVRDAGVPLVDAVAMVTAVPAQVAGLADTGRLAAGQRADLVVWDDGFVPWRVMRGGAWPAANLR